MGLYKYVVRVRVWGIFMNDKNIFIGVCEDNSLHLNLVKGYIDDFFNEFHNYEVLEFVSGEDLLSMIERMRKEEQTEEMKRV